MHIRRMHRNATPENVNTNGTTNFFNCGICHLLHHASEDCSSMQYTDEISDGRKELSSDTKLDGYSTSDSDGHKSVKWNKNAIFPSKNFQRLSSYTDLKTRMGSQLSRKTFPGGEKSTGIGISTTHLESNNFLERNNVQVNSSTPLTSTTGQKPTNLTNTECVENMNRLRSNLKGISKTAEDKCPIEDSPVKLIDHQKDTSASMHAPTHGTIPEPKSISTFLPGDSILTNQSGTDLEEDNLGCFTPVKGKKSFRTIAG